LASTSIKLKDIRGRAAASQGLRERMLLIKVASQP
jgi:hypothetical protein